MKKSILRFIEKYGIYCLGAMILILNISLAFDNVVWGDEAYSGTVIQGTDLRGIFQRIYYWDSHPPLYYYWLRFFASIFGYNTVVFHFASLVPFMIGILLAVFMFSKKIGKIPVAFFIILSGLAAPCVEYNLEIRMYSLVFMELLVCTWCSYRIVESEENKKEWLLLTLFGVAAAYSHYYGLIVSGILLFITIVFEFIARRRIFRGVSSLLAYIIMYMPWLVVFVKQAKEVKGSWWLSEVEPISVLTTMIFCGENLKTILALVVISFTLIILIKESHIISTELEEGHDYVTWKFNKPSIKHWSTELIAILLFWMAIVLTIAFTYIASYILNPLTVARYMYPLVPIVLFILMLVIRRILAYGKVSWGGDNYGYVYEEKNGSQISLVNTKGKGWCRIVFAMVATLFIIISGIACWDFKYYRSVSKTQEFQTQKVLAIIGEPQENVVFTSISVKHLAWTVLPYYFPEHEVLECFPNDVDAEKNEMWSFVSEPMSEEAMMDMSNKGYMVDVYLDLWMGKYSCHLYHFYR